MIQGDTTREDDVAAAFVEAARAFGSLDAVVVNAGIMTPTMPLADMSIDRLSRMFDTNTLGSFLFAREAARPLPEQMSGKDAAIVPVFLRRPGSDLRMTSIMRPAKARSTR